MDSFTEVVKYLGVSRVWYNYCITQNTICFFNQSCKYQYQDIYVASAPLDSHRYDHCIYHRTACSKLDLNPFAAKYSLINLSISFCEIC